MSLRAEQLAMVEPGMYCRQSDRAICCTIASFWRASARRIWWLQSSQKANNCATATARRSTHSIRLRAGCGPASMSMAERDMADFLGGEAILVHGLAPHQSSRHQILEEKIQTRRSGGNRRRM